MSAGNNPVPYQSPISDDKGIVTNVWSAWFRQILGGGGSSVTLPVSVANGGTGQTTASTGLNALLPSQGSSAGKVLGTDGSNASWITGSSGLTALTGDVTATGTGSVAATIAANAVTNAKAAQMAAHTFKGNNTGLTANASDLTATQLTAELNALVGDTGSGGTKGLVPAPASGDAAAGKFLKADGTFAVPPVTGITALTGDGTATGSGSSALTLATVNSNTGTFGSATQVPAVTVNGKGLITGVANTSIQIAESQVTNLTTDLAAKAPLASPALTGTPTAPTATAGTNTTQLATTAFVATSFAPLASPALTGTPTVPTATAGTSTTQAASTAFVASAVASVSGNSTLITPVFRNYLSGTGTHNRAYSFIISSGNATAGATYTNNGVSFTVLNTVASAVIVQMSGSGVPTSSGTLTKATGTGDATLTFSTYRIPIYQRVRMVGGGGGGGGGANVGATAGSAGTAGGNTTFGTSLLVANGGAGGPGGSGLAGQGGTASLGSGPVGTALSGADSPPGPSGSASNNVAGGIGASTPFGGAGSSNWAGIGTAAKANTGSGGGGGGCNNTAASVGGFGGAAGGFIDALIYSPTTSYGYAVGTGGALGANGTSGYNGASGGSGYIESWEYFQ